MKFLINTLGRILYYPYRLATLYEREKQLKFITKNISINKTSKITASLRIRNYQENKEKIIIGDYTMLAGELLVFRHGGKIKIGDHCYIGEGTRIWSATSIQIGNRVLIAHNVDIHDQNAHPLDSIQRHEDYKVIFEKGLQESIDYNEKPIIIEDDVWIGFNATIHKGVRIGRGAIIGSNTIITNDVQSYTVVVGNPPRVIKHTT